MLLIKSSLFLATFLANRNLMIGLDFNDIHHPAHHLLLLLHLGAATHVGLHLACIVCVENLCHAEQQAEKAQVVADGPDVCTPADDGVIR